MTKLKISTSVVQKNDGKRNRIKKTAVRSSWVWRQYRTVIGGGMKLSNGLNCFYCFTAVIYWNTLLLAMWIGLNRFRRPCSWYILRFKLCTSFIYNFKKVRWGEETHTHLRIQMNRRSVCLFPTLSIWKHDLVRFRKMFQQKSFRFGCGSENIDAISDNSLQTSLDERYFLMTDESTQTKNDKHMTWSDNFQLLCPRNVLSVQTFTFFIIMILLFNKIHFHGNILKW